MPQKIKAEEMTDLVAQGNANVKQILPNVTKKMSLYLSNKQTEYILFKPIRVSLLISTILTCL